MMTVNVRASKEYNVEIGDGIVSKLGEMTKAVCPKAIKALIVSETNVAALYLDAVKAQLEGAGLEVAIYVFEAGEKSKNINEIAGMWNKMAEAGFTRTDIVVGLGGGVTTDMAGFAASTFLLPDEVFTEGMGEVTKYAFIMDEKLLDLLEKQNGNIRDDAAVLENVIGMCVADKAEVIGEDENDNGRRQILNFGHTAGHVIERDSGFTKPHGICVAKGMGIFMDACVKAGTLSAEDAKRMKDLLAMYKLPVSDEITAEDIVKGAMNDKKKRGNTLSVILVNKIGKAEIKKMTAEEFLKFLSV